MILSWWLKFYWIDSATLRKKSLLLISVNFFVEFKLKSSWSRRSTSRFFLFKYWFNYQKISLSIGLSYYSWICLFHCLSWIMKNNWIWRFTFDSLFQFYSNFCIWIKKWASLRNNLRGGKHNQSEKKLIEVKVKSPWTLFKTFQSLEVSSQINHKFQFHSLHHQFLFPDSTSKLTVISLILSIEKRLGFQFLFLLSTPFRWLW